jgi:starch phosphorylase
MRERVGSDNMFTFGLCSDEIAGLKSNSYRPQDIVSCDPDLTAVLESIANGRYSPEEPDRYRELIDGLLNGGDRYCLIADFASYRQAQQSVDTLFNEPSRWSSAAILNVAGMGYFASDRAIGEYAEKIWRISPRR